MTVKFPIYMDNHATTKVDPRVLNVMMPYFSEKYGNASSVDHVYGLAASRAVEESRENVARLIGSKPEEIIFTAGATESNNMAIQGIAEKYSEKGDHIITSSVEHKAILNTCNKLEEIGKRVTYLPVDAFGQVNPKDVKSAITDETILISIMMANNEVGTINPIKEIGKIAHDHGILFHSDVAQAAGHVPINVEEMNIDLLSMSAHKFYGPKGIGALYTRSYNPRVKFSPILFGGSQERGLRPGTYNVPCIVGMGSAAEIAMKEMSEEGKKFRKWTNQMFESFSENYDGVKLNGHKTDRLPHNLNVFFPNIESKALITALKDKVSFSAGSACTTTTVKPSHVLKAMGFSDDRAYSSVRFGLGRFNTEEEVRYVEEKIIDNVKGLAKFRS